MKKSIFIAVTMLAGSVVFAQEKIKEPPSPPPPPAVKMNEVLPPPPPPKPIGPPSVMKTDLSGDYLAFLKRNPTIKELGWSYNNTVHIYLKSGKEEIYNLNNKEEVQKLKNQYGELPAAPPPPPPAPRSSKHLTES